MHTHTHSDAHAQTHAHLDVLRASTYGTLNILPMVWKDKEEADQGQREIPVFFNMGLSNFALTTSTEI